jgi:hypothetical protein
MKSFYNTNKTTGTALKEARSKAKTQEERIYEFFREHKDKVFTPMEVQDKVFGNTAPITSIRRAISNLTEVGKLDKTDKTRLGYYGKNNYCWKFRE